MLKKIWFQILKEQKISFPVMYNTHNGLGTVAEFWAPECKLNVKSSRKFWNSRWKSPLHIYINRISSHFSYFWDRFLLLLNGTSYWNAVFCKMIFEILRWTWFGKKITSLFLAHWWRHHYVTWPFFPKFPHFFTSKLGMKWHNMLHLVKNWVRRST